MLRRQTGDSSLARHLDRVSLAPGFSYAERFVGTNGIGTALESGAAATVYGHEHFAEHLEHLACAAAPVRHPSTGEVAGVVNLTCRAADAGVLLLTTVTSIAAQIRQALLEEAGRRERALLDAFLAACRRAPLEGQGGQAVLLERALALASGRREVVVDLPDGTRASVLCRSTTGARDGDAVLRTAPAQRQPSGLVVGPGLQAAWSAARQAAAGGRLLLEGEPGSGRATLARAAASGPVRALDAADASGPGWCDAVAGALADGGWLLLRDAHLLDSATTARVAGLLAAAPAPVAVTALPGSTPEELGGLLSDPVPVPPLRHRPEDLPALTRALLVRATGRRVPLADDVVPLLARHAWPGGAGELARVLAACAPARGPLQAAHLPAALQALARRRLTPCRSSSARRSPRRSPAAAATGLRRERRSAARARRSTARCGSTA